MKKVLNEFVPNERYVSYENIDVVFKALMKGYEVFVIDRLNNELNCLTDLKVGYLADMYKYGLEHTGEVVFYWKEEVEEEEEEVEEEEVEEEENK